MRKYDAICNSPNNFNLLKKYCQMKQPRFKSHEYQNTKNTKKKEPSIGNNASTKQCWIRSVS